MREITATEAGRNFSALLDEAERGETIVVTRGGVRVATFSPAWRSNGAALLEVFRRWRESGVADDDFASRVADVREAVDEDLDVDPWNDCRMVGPHCRVQADSLLDHMRRDEQRRRAAADELTALTQEMRLY
ncbi:type II toxin-antitoxin system prevent-host-death family antitoxin [Saccharopolyspora sp. K220]|uniref:type II toxin-antitoxin system Phd/YefM family antitoxin n=1 Tax=Saccharopolyspora soli TaxID=2926618 RepID=UPI001F5A66D4|nr:type II toxin-antitoxin system prevent-host-death family antitoxin [Saccharopolyspora soli]MCI2417048.1 type II toxin-antitoxin system prevent-host-death family antitoxin [Saccharopolyspora soli]